jgi:S-formylglutathione hydrolase FrmB
MRIVLSIFLFLFVIQLVESYGQYSQQIFEKNITTALWVNNGNSGNLPVGTKYETYFSSMMGHDVGYAVFLPNEYFSTETSLPVIYFFHGKGGDEIGASRQSSFLQEAISKGKIRPCIAVFVNGMYSSFYCDSYDKKYLVESSFIKELIPHIENRFRVIKGRQGRALNGFSMGGHASIKFILKYPESFCSTVVYGPALLKAQYMKEIQPLEYQIMFNNDETYYKQFSPYELVEPNKQKVQAYQPGISIFGGTKDPSGVSAGNFHQLLLYSGIFASYQLVENVSHNLDEYYAAIPSAGFEAHESHFKQAFTAIEMNGIVFEISPNPAQLNFRVEIPNQQFDLNLFDERGMKILHFSGLKDKINIETGNLPNGVYLVQLITSNKEILTRKLIVSR